MKTKLLTLTLTAGLIASFGSIAFAHDEDEARRDDQRFNRHARFERGDDRLASEVDHLNRMLAHVEGEMRQGGADRHMWREYQHLRAETRQLSWRFRRGEQYYNRGDLRAQIEHMHAELHHLEEELHVQPAQWFQWR